MKLTFYLLPLLIITIFGCISALSQEKDRWFFVSNNSDGTLFYIDKNSRQVSGKNIRIWNKSVFWNGSFRLDLVEWKCSEKKYFFVEASDYTSTGKFVRKNVGTEWINVVPDSISEDLHKVVCGNSPEENPKTVSMIKKMAEVIVRKANLRVAPSMSGNVVQQVKLGSKFFLADEEPTNGWYQIILSEPNESAWIHGNNIKIIEIANNSNSKKQK
jgi:hypothetical protein